jgi:GT2 family glycosyltransferase
MRLTPSNESAISAVVPAHRDLPPLLRTLDFLERCDPRPAEVLVHVDGGSAEILSSVRARHPAVRLLVSDELLGPGGSRNRLVAAAKYEWVANFDDDSFPAQVSYFGRVAALIDRFPDAAILSAASHAAEWQTSNIERVGIFSGCGCVFRKSLFEKLGGFVPLPVAYGMEEVDLSLRTHAAGGLIIHDPLLRVRHEPLPGRVRDHAAISAAVLANTALFPALRFPWWLLGFGLYQILRRIVWMIQLGEGRSVLPGLRRMPQHLWMQREHRKPVPGRTVFSWQLLRRHPSTLEDGARLSNAWQEDANWNS